MGTKVWDQLKKIRPPRWVLEMYDPVAGRVRAYMYEWTESIRSEVVNQWVTLFRSSSREECERERDAHRDKSGLRIRNVDTDEEC